MTENYSQHKAIKKPVFSGSLTRTVLFALLFLSVFPVALLGSVTYFRSTRLLQQQVNQQLKTIVTTYTDQLENYVEQRQSALKPVFRDPVFQNTVEQLFSTETDNFEKNQAQDQFRSILLPLTETQPEKFFDQVIMLDQTGKVIAATNNTWLGLDLSTFPEIRRLQNTSTDTSGLLFNFASFYPDQLVVITASPTRMINEAENGLIVGFSSSALLDDVLRLSSQFYPDSRAFFSVTNGVLIGLDNQAASLVEMQIDSEQQQRISDLQIQQSAGKTFLFNDFSYYAYVTRVTPLQATFILSVPETTALGQIQTLGPLNLALFIIAILISGTLIYIGTTRMVYPLVQLANKANLFAQGDWDQRAVVNRRDEIGVLAFSFNQMVEQLTNLYRSMEEKVEARTRQLNLASRIAQLATTASTQEEILQNTVDLVAEHFSFDYAGIYAIDTVFNQAALRAFSTVYQGSGFDPTAREKYYVPLNVTSMIATVVANQKSITVSDVATEDIFHYKGIVMPETRSMALVPVIINESVIGILDLQSAQPERFDQDLVNVLESLARQISIGIRNISLLESTQVDLAETTVLYETTRHVSQLTSEKEILAAIQNSFEKTSYISAVFEIAGDFLRMISLTDRQGKKFHTNLSGVALPLKPNELEYFQSQSIYITDNLASPDYFENLVALLARRGCQSVAILPVISEDRPSLLFALGTRAEKELNQAGLQPFINLAAVTGSALERIRYIKQIEYRLSHLETYEKLANAVADEDDLQLIFHATHQLINSKYGGNINFLFALYDSKTNLIEIPYVYESNDLLEVEPFKLGEGLTSYIIKNRKPLLISKDVRQKTIELGTKIVGKPAKSWMGAPLICENQVIGAVIVQDPDIEMRFTGEDLELLERLAPQIGAAIVQSRRISELRQSLQSYELERFLLNTLLENIPEHITFKDRHGKYIKASQSFMAEMGYKEKDVEGLTDVDFFGAHLANQYYQEEQELIRNQENLLGIIENTLDRNKQERWFRHNKMPMITDSGQTIGLMNITEDITNLKLAEEIAQKRAEQVQTASEIARDTAGTLDLPVLLRNAVNLVRDRFGFYHASIFLLDPLQEYAVLEESTGEAGEKMKAAHHRLAVGSQSTVGAAAASQEPVVNNNVTQSENYYPNPLLPDTRSELAIPLIVSGNILGALDVQSTQVGAFSPEDIQTLQILADQLAIAILTANLFTSVQSHLEKHRLLHQITSAAASSSTVDDVYQHAVEGLISAMPDKRISIYTFKEGRLFLQASAGYGKSQPAQDYIDSGRGIIGSVAQSRVSIRANDTLQDSRYIQLEPDIRSELAVPIQYADRFFGVLNLESPDLAAFDESDQEIMTTLGTGLGSILSVTQLVEQIRRQVTRQRQLFEITNKLRRTVDIETIAKISVEEISRVLGASKTSVHIYQEDSLSTAEVHTGAKNGGDS